MELDPKKGRKVEPEPLSREVEIRFKTRRRRRHSFSRKRGRMRSFLKRAPTSAYLEHLVLSLEHNDVIAPVVGGSVTDLHRRPLLHPLLSGLLIQENKSWLRHWFRQDNVSTLYDPMSCLNQWRNQDFSRKFFLGEPKHRWRITGLTDIQVTTDENRRQITDSSNFG